MRTFLAIALLTVLSATTLAQDLRFPWEKFQPRTIPEVIALTRKGLKPNQSKYFTKDMLESKTQVIFTGQSRPTMAPRYSFIGDWWALLRPYLRGLAQVYPTEYLYQQGDMGYWLPTAKKLTNHLEKELKPGDRIDIYFFSIGAYRARGKVDSVLVVDEFQKTNNE